MTYYLTLSPNPLTPAAAQELDPDTYQAVFASWQPYNPNRFGWQDNDVLIITCSFSDIVEGNSADLPGADKYIGLCIGACKVGDTDAIQKLEARIINTVGQLGLNEGHILHYDGDYGEVYNISKAPNNPKAMFYAEELPGVNIYLQPETRGELVDYIYQWKLTYNGNNPVTTNKEVELVFGFGDPHVGTVGPPVRK